MAAGWTKKETGALASIWRQPNVQNELDFLNLNIFFKFYMKILQNKECKDIQIAKANVKVYPTNNYNSKKGNKNKQTK